MDLSPELRQAATSSAVGAATALIFFWLLQSFSRTQRAEPEHALKEPDSPRRRSARQAQSRDRLDNFGAEAIEGASVYGGIPATLSRQFSSEDSLCERPAGPSVERHTEDATLRLPNAYLMQRGRAARPRQIGQRFGPARTEVVRIALTGGPCAGKSSALDHLTRAATAEGFDVLTAPEVATLYFNASYQLPTPADESFGANLFTFQKNVLKLQLQLERCFTDMAARTERPTIVVFDRGLLDCKAYMSVEMWQAGVAELDAEVLPSEPVTLALTIPLSWPPVCSRVCGAAARHRPTGGLSHRGAHANALRRRGAPGDRRRRRAVALQVWRGGGRLGRAGA